MAIVGDEFIVNSAKKDSNKNANKGTKNSRSYLIKEEHIRLFEFFYGLVLFASGGFGINLSLDPQFR